MKLTAEKREYARQAMKKHRAKLSKESAKGRELKYKYGISWEKYVLLHDSQGGSCKICKSPIALLSSDQTKTANVDHCHTTGKIRGLLCGDCNRGIGLLKDSPAILRYAAEYLDAADGGNSTWTG